MDEVGSLQLAITLETLKTLIMAPKEVTQKGHTMWPTTLKTCPIMKVANTATYETILIVASIVRIYDIKLISIALDAHIIQRTNPFIFVKGLLKSKIIPSINRLRIYRSR